jgi:hypothetical protein
MTDKETEIGFLKWWGEVGGIEKGAAFYHSRAAWAEQQKVINKLEEQLEDLTL